MAYIAGPDRSQAVLLPEVLDDYVRAHNPVRFLDAFVAQLDLGTLGFQRAVPAETGRLRSGGPAAALPLWLPPPDPLQPAARAGDPPQCRADVAAATAQPRLQDHRGFPSHHPEALNGVCREFIVLCRRPDLFGGELLAIDGSKFRAVNARDQC